MTISKTRVTGKHKFLREPAVWLRGYFSLYRALRSDGYFCCRAIAYESKMLTAGEDGCLCAPQSAYMDVGAFANWHRMCH